MLGNKEERERTRKVGTTGADGSFGATTGADGSFGATTGAGGGSYGIIVHMMIMTHNMAITCSIPIHMDMATQSPHLISVLARHIYSRGLFLPSKTIMEVGALRVM